MRSIITRLVVIVLAATLFAAPAAAQDAVSDTPWQDVITHQIQAFRDGDAPAAFSDAGQMFQVAFPSAEAFFGAIMGSGYAPIMESRAHSFGPYRLEGDTAVLQAVTLTGRSQELFDAIYELRVEDGVWRVQGVQLQKSTAIGI